MRIFGLDIRRAPTPADLLITERKRREERGLVFYDSTHPDLARMVFGGAPTASGIRVTEETSIQISAVWACVRVLSDDIAKLPLKLYRRNGKAREEARDHPLYRVLHDEGNELMTAATVRRVIMAHLLLWGNAYCEKDIDRRGRLVGLWPIHPANVRIDVEKNEYGRPVKIYVIDQPGGTQRRLSNESIFHIPGLGFNGYEGKSVIRLARETMGISLAAERYGARFFSNDGAPGAVLMHPNALSETAYDRLKNEFNEFKGADKAHKLKILEEGMRLERVGLPPEDMQFIDTRKFQVTEIARWFRVPPHKIGDLEKATFSNIEHQAIEYVTDSVSTWTNLIEQSVNMWLLDEGEKGVYYAEHNVDGLLRGDIASRYDAYTKARNWGWINADEIREKENMNPLPDGKGQIYLQPLNMVEAGSTPEPIDTLPSDEPRSIRSIERRAVPPRYTTAKALEPVFLDTFRRLMKRENAEIRKALAKYLPDNKDGFVEWLEGFVEENAAWMEPRLRPLYDTMAEAMVSAAVDEIGTEITPDDLGDFVQRYTETYVQRHAGSTRGQLEALADEEDPLSAIDTRLAEWDETRAEKEAVRERQRSSNAITKAAWAVMGIASIIWRTSGDTCPICNEMAGRSTLINVPFLSAGATIANLTTSGNIGHPPLHRGCDCYLDPVIGTRSHARPSELRSIFDSILSEPEHEYHNHD